MPANNQESSGEAFQEKSHLHIVDDPEVFDTVAAHAAKVARAWELFAHDGHPRHIELPDSSDIPPGIVRPNFRTAPAKLVENQQEQRHDAYIDNRPSATQHRIHHPSVDK